MNNLIYNKNLILKGVLTMKNLIKITTISTAFLSLILTSNVEAQSNINKSREIEGKNNTGNLIRAQQAFHFEKQKFTKSMSELGITLPSQYYQVNIPIADANKAIIITTPKTNNLKSYTGGVSSSNGNYSSILCESLSITTKITNPILKGNTWSCGTGFTEIR
jgi:hypothetical protein